MKLRRVYSPYFSLLNSYFISHKQFPIFQPLVKEVVAGNSATTILAGAPNIDISSYILSSGGYQSTIMRAATQMLEACEGKKGSSITLTWCKVKILIQHESIWICFLVFLQLKFNEILLMF